MVDYLDKLRASGVSEAMVEGERDGWILMAARWPEKIPEFMVDKMAQLDDPRTVQLYRLIDELVEVGMDEDRLNAVADLMVEMAEESAERGELEQQSEDMGDDAFIALLDSFATDAHPMVERLQELLAERGWTGWSRIERAPPTTPPHGTRVAEATPRRCRRPRTVHRAGPSTLVAGAGFEPAKEYSDGFTVRSHWPLGQPAGVPRHPGLAGRQQGETIAQARRRPENASRRT